MPDYGRHYVPGGTYLFTLVTRVRSPILTSNLGRVCLREVIEQVRQDLSFEIVAVVLLPDHWHIVWTLPREDFGYPLRWMCIKEEFTKRWLQRRRGTAPIGISRATTLAWRVAETLLGAHGMR